MEKISNIPDLLGVHIGNFVGLSPTAMLVVIAVLTAVMSAFNYQIRFRDGSRYYPVLYSLFGLTLLATFYYIMQAELPGGCIGWHCQASLAGGTGWAIAGIVLTTLVSFGIFIATMQTVAQVSVEAGMSLQEKRWKEWKWGLAIVLVGLSVSGIAYEVSRTFAGWALLITAMLTVAFVIFKIVRDTIYCGNFLWALLIGVVFLLGTAASMALFLEVIHACVYLVVFFVVFMAQAKARKKKPRDTTK